MKIVVLIVRLLLGLVFLVFGLNAFQARLPLLTSSSMHRSDSGRCRTMGKARCFIAYLPISRQRGWRAVEP
jgi:hypothetical protein